MKVSVRSVLACVLTTASLALATTVVSGATANAEPRDCVGLINICSNFQQVSGPRFGHREGCGGCDDYNGEPYGFRASWDWAPDDADPNCPPEGFTVAWVAFPDGRGTRAAWVDNLRSYGDIPWTRAYPNGDVVIKWI